MRHTFIFRKATSASSNPHAAVSLLNAPSNTCPANVSSALQALPSRASRPFTLFHRQLDPSSWIPWLCMYMYVPPSCLSSPVP